MLELPGAQRPSVKVEVRMKDGRILSESTNEPKGDPGNPMTEDEIISKFYSNIEYSQKIGSNKAKQLLSRIQHIQELNDINKMTSLIIK
jgi:2-methylcitrate dehydratase PrpD